MAHLLYRLGRSAARGGWRVVAAWVAVLALAVGGYLAFAGTLATSFSIPGTETDRVSTQLSQELSGAAGATGTVVFRTEDDAPFTSGQRQAISAALARVGTLDDVGSAVDPFATSAQRAQQSQQLTAAAAQVAAGSHELSEAQAQLDAQRERLEQTGAPPQSFDQVQARQEALDSSQAQLQAQAQQLQLSQRLLELGSGIRTVSDDGTTAIGAVLFTEDQFSLPAEVKQSVIDTVQAADLPGVRADFSTEIASSADGVIGGGEVIGVLMAAMVLMLMLRTLLPAVLPLVTSLVGVGIGVIGSLAFSDVVTMSSVTPVLGVMLGLAVGIDYSLFIINRHRRQLRSGVELHESIGLATGTAGNAVVFAGSTVVLALLALNVTRISFIGVMGTVGAVCVLVAVLLAVTLVPALLGLIGVRVLDRRSRRRHGAHVDRSARAQPMSSRRAVLALVLSVAALLVVAIPALSIRLGLPDGSQEAEGSTQYQAYTTTAQKFGAGQNGTLVVTAALPDGVAEDDELATQVDLADRIDQLDDVVAVAPAGVSDDRSFFAFQVVPADGPASVSTRDLVQDLRALSPLPGDVQLGVAGVASGNIDVSQKISDVLPIYLAVVIGFSLLILVVVFRSLLVPVLATGGFVLSLFAALGAVVAVYQWGWLSGLLGVTSPGPVLNFAPLIIIGVLFGLAMDYQLFLVSGMREAYVHGTPARGAVMLGLRNGRTVVTAAAIIMVAVFGGFVFSHISAIKPLGFGLATGVLFDAFVVRMLVVPAVMHLVGDKAWWLPRWLDRLPPDVDVEGAALEGDHPATPARPARDDRLVPAPAGQA